MKLINTNILNSIIFTTLYLTKGKCGEIQDDYLKDTVRAELFTMTDYNIPDIYVNMSEESLEELFDQGSEGLRIGDMLINNIQFGPNEIALGPGKKRDPDDVSGLNPPGSTERFKVTDANLKFVLNGNEKIIDSVNVSVGGKSSLISKKLGYNIKCNKGNLYGRKNLRIRATVADASFLRSKISSDILNRLGIPSISANYVRAYFNDQFMGLYVLVDAYKKSWIKQVFPEDEDVRDFYQCSVSNSNFSKNNLILCANANEEYGEEKESLEDFITTINGAKTREDVEDFMDVDEFARVWLFEWLVGTWDSSLLSAKNYYLYKPINGKWLILPYDFDTTFGYRLAGYLSVDKPEEVPFEEWYDHRYIVDVLLKNDRATFISNLQYILDKAFNPELLFPHIDSLKAWLTPYVEEDHTPVNGTYPGYINQKLDLDQKPFSMEEFEGNSEYTEVNYGPGLKQWIQSRYNFVCSYYPVTCNPSYLTPESEAEETSTATGVDPDSEPTPSTTDEIATTTLTDSEETEAPEKESCWSEALGYTCCTRSCSVVAEDKEGLWGAENGEWCGIPWGCQVDYDQCWSSYYGYPCCTHCQTILTDDAGSSWGAEHGEWCGIVEEQCQN